jgi:L-ascorbate metabolism protein UlaG (beta-lactamase superfamily)
LAGSWNYLRVKNLFFGLLLLIFTFPLSAESLRSGLKVPESASRTSGNIIDLYNAETKEKAAQAQTLQQGKGVQAVWFGHSSFYLVSKSGVRIVIDPFTENFPMEFPRNLEADIVLITYESNDRGGAERLIGSPMVYRGAAGMGKNIASGVTIQGISSWRDNSKGARLGRNMIYKFELDGVQFCHLGGLGEELHSMHLDQIGKVDVLFVPAGNKAISVKDQWANIEKLNPKWIVPVAYQNTKYPELKDLRPLEEFLKKGVEVREVKDNRFTFTKEELPKSPTILLFKKP